MGHWVFYEPSASLVHTSSPMAPKVQKSGNGKDTKLENGGRTFIRDIKLLMCIVLNMFPYIDCNEKGMKVFHIYH